MRQLCKKSACWLLIIILALLFRLNFCHSEIPLVFSCFGGHDCNEFLKCGSILTMLKGKKEADYCTEGKKKKLSGCQYGFVIPLLWILRDIEGYLLPSKAWTGSCSVCVYLSRQFAVISTEINLFFFLFSFFPVDLFISYYFCFCLKK